MKLLKILFLLLPIIPLYARAEAIQPDTIKTIPVASSVTISRLGSETTVTATIPDEDETGSFKLYTYKVSVTEPDIVDNDLSADDITLKLPFMRSQTEKSANRPPEVKRYITGFKYMYWGWNFNYDNKSGIRNSFELSIADVIGIDWQTSRKTTLGIGLGFGFNRVTTDNYALWNKDGDKLTIVQAPENANVEYARLNSWRFQVPLMFRQKLAGEFALGLAAIVNFNTYSTATNRYKQDRVRYTETIKGINQRLLTVDLMATLGIANGIGVYGKWSPMTAMQSIYGPSYRNFSIGVNFNF